MALRPSLPLLQLPQVDKCRKVGLLAATVQLGQGES